MDVRAQCRGLGTAIVLCSFLYQTQGLSKFNALALATMLAILPGTWLTALDVQSEPLYLLLTVSCLLALTHPRSSRAWLLAGACCGLALITRTVGVSLLAVFLFKWWRDGRHSGFAPVVAALGPAVSWMALRAVFGFAASYTDGTHQLLRGSLAKIVAGIEMNTSALAAYGVRSFDLAGHLYAQIVLAGLVLCAIFECARRAWRGEADALYVVQPPRRSRCSPC
ncbi:MAG: hypothetical protein EXR86_11670 [Gammaproteobacteria bacterium]|nr:hypothetical protein [Gammaproteobacteria bacterium]